MTILFGYILLQFLWWEFLLVKQNGLIIDEKQKLTELASANETQLKIDIAALHQRKKMQTVMIVSEGTVFLLLLLFGIYKIKQAQDKETVLNNQQKNFFLSITHELKTPIAATKLQLQTLQKQKLDPDTQQELIGNALLENERLNVLIDNVLFTSRLDAGEYKFKKEKHNLGELTEATMSRYYKREIATGQVKLNVEPGIYAVVDTDSFPSVITNLVDNAIKYSPGKKEIVVALTLNSGKAVLSVSDSGCGIANADKEKIFSKFYRAGNEETRSSKGTGLGLYIVNYIVKNHNGKISVKDNLPAGSIFEIRLHVA
ncbi:MAG TPA: HAMP domain-containing sensor histidine kinase [Bacteroidia bacterium]|nr:HAMP domain-containing sensor histidine kinase [Bacteroidia bacterium]